jgi:hypothetical protein
MFHTLAPCRLLDTRNANGPLGGPSLGGTAQRTFAVTNTCGVPPGALAISANVTAVNPAAQGYAIAFPAGIPAPLASTISFRAGRTRANNALIGLSTGGSMIVRNNSAGTLDIIVDVNGYYR